MRPNLTIKVENLVGLWLKISERSYVPISLILKLRYDLSKKNGPQSLKRPYKSSNVHINFFYFWSRGIIRFFFKSEILIKNYFFEQKLKNNLRNLAHYVLKSGHGLKRQSHRIKPKPRHCFQNSETNVSKKTKQPFQKL